MRRGGILMVGAMANSAVQGGKAAVPNADLAQRSMTALLWNMAGGGGKVAAQLLIQIALARMLGPAAFGQYSAVLIVLGIGWLLADGGFGAALVQKQTLDDGDVGQALGWVLLVASVVAVTIAAAAPLLSEQFADPSLTPMFRAVSVLVFLVGLSNISTSLLRRELDMKRLQIIQLVSYLGGFGLVAMLLAAMGWGAWSLVIGFGVQTALTCGAGFAIAQHSLRPCLGGDRGLRAFGIKVVLTNIANWAIENMDRFLIGRFWGVPALGLYSVAFNLSRAPVGMLIDSVQSVGFSAASRIQEDDERIRKSYLAVLSALAMVTFPAFAIICVEAEYVMRIVYGAKWLAAVPLLAAFAVATPIHGLAAVTGPLLWARGAVEKELYSQILIAIVLLGGFVLLRHTSLTLAVWLVPAAYLLRFAFLFAALQRLLSVSLIALFHALAGGLMIAIGALFADATMHRFWPDETLANIASIAAALFFVVLITRYMGKWLICAELRSILQGRRDESSVVRALCQFLRLAAEPA